jgi:hypothetical protein
MRSDVEPIVRRHVTKPSVTRRQRALAAVLVAGLATSLGGCTGLLDDPPAAVEGRPRLPGSDPGAVGDGAAADSAPGFVVPEDPGLRLLALDQYRATVRAAAAVLDPTYPESGHYYPDGRLAEVRLPSDPTALARGEPPFSQFLAVAIAIASEVVADQSEMVALLGGCPTAADTEEMQRACIDTFLRSKLAPLFRRTPSEPEIAYYRDEVARYPLTVEHVRELVVTLFISPHFLFHAEHGVGPDIEPVVDLTGEELAARIAYLLWRAPPDQALVDAGRAGELEGDTARRAHVERLLADPRSDAFFRALLIRWLDLRPERLQFNRVQSTRFELSTGGILEERTREELEALGGQMIDELAAFVGYLARRGERVPALFTTELSLAGDPILAQIYGVAPWDGTGAPPTLPRARGGLLGHLAFFANAANDTHPILTGVRVYRDLLCVALADPPSVVTPGPLPTPPYSTRAEVEALTGSETCQVCHSLFNGYGFAFEAFDQIGQWRTDDPVFFLDTITDRLPIDTRGTVALGDAGLVEIGSTVELASRIAESGMIEPCVARNLAIVGLDRFDPPREVIDSVGERLRSGSIVDGIDALIASSAFRRRSFGAE